MNKPTFREQYDKIVGAYLRNELRPFDSCACFIGNLLQNDGWCYARIFSSVGRKAILERSKGMYDIGARAIKEASNGLYDVDDIIILENNFLGLLKNIEHERWVDTKEGHFYNTEESLYEAMESTLLLLKQIHESKGEAVEDYSFSKRQLQTV